jgi:hypothetical protein
MVQAASWGWLAALAARRSRRFGLASFAFGGSLRQRTWSATPWPKASQSRKSAFLQTNASIAPTVTSSRLR